MKAGYSQVESIRSEEIGSVLVEVHRIVTADRAIVALTRVLAPEAMRPPVILAPGTFANRHFWLSSKGKGFSVYLRDAGYECWIYEWREHGQAKHRGLQRERASFDTLIEYDVGAVLSYVFEQAKQERPFWIGHSAGGTMIYGHLSLYPDTQRWLRGIISLGTQTTHFVHSLSARLRLWLAFPLTHMLGYFPARALGLGPEDELGGLIREWARWNLRGAWKSLTGVDYMAGLKQVRLPVLALAGGGDVQLAPEAGCRVLFNALGTNNKAFRLLSQGNGHRVDYDHNALVISDAAQAEVWPMIRAWLDEQSASGT
jgi:predicted alpha/beta hydrolase